MNFLFLIVLLNQFEFQLTLICQEDATRFNLRGQYKDVLSELNGGLLETARQMYFYGVEDQRSPLKDRIYFSNSDTPGFPMSEHYQSMSFSLIQTYEINTLIIWFSDYDRRIHNFQVFMSNKSNEVKIYEGFVWGQFKLKFLDRLVQKIRIYALGNSLNCHMSILKVQAFYARNNS